MYRHTRTWIKMCFFTLLSQQLLHSIFLSIALFYKYVCIGHCAHVFRRFRGYRNENGLNSSWWITSNTVLSSQKKWSCLLKTSSVNVTKSTDSCRFGHIYWRNFKWKTSFFLQCIIRYPQFERSSGISLFGKMNEICSKLTNKSEQP